METEKIIESTRAALGLEQTGEDFNFEIILHINAALAILNQNGVGVENTMVSATTTWGDFKDPAHINGNKMFTLVPMFVMTRTKILFDPPPPSNVEFYHTYIQELLWRLRIAYDLDTIINIIEEA